MPAEKRFLEYSDWLIKKICSQELEISPEPVVNEEPLEIQVNGEPVAILMRLPGRATSELVLKAARVGISLVASVSVLSSLAVELAESLGCTLTGSLRGRKVNIYAHQERIAF